MTLRIKKTGVSSWDVFWVLLVCGFLCVWPRMVNAAPYSFDARFHKTGDGAAYLALTVTPMEDGVYLYASKSQSRGKATEASAFVDGKPLGAAVIYPQGTDKADPLAPGTKTRVFEGVFTVLIPVEAPFVAGKEAMVRLQGLACSAMNCTPIDVSRAVSFPDPGTLLRASASAQGLLASGVAEPMPAAPEREQAGYAHALPTTSGLFVGKSTAVSPPEKFLEKLSPVPFTPELEVNSLAKALFLGFLAGMLLNLMPCVLPVLGIKISALLQCGADDGDSIRRFRRHQAFFALGILAWFSALAVVLYRFELAWGQIFQSPAVVFALAVLLLLLALNLFGVLSLPLIDFRMGNPTHPDLQAFTSGFTATLLATPCGGPLLGGVLSWALMQPFGVLALALWGVGLGMAFPYIMLAFFPVMASRFPRPGAWMGALEQVLGFLLLATVAYLVSFLPSIMLPRVVAALVLAAFGGWLWGKRKAAAKVAGVLCVAFACVWPFAYRAVDVAWEPYSHNAFSAELGKRVIMVDFTADWCPTCKVMEATALSGDALRAWKNAYNLALFQVDMTRSNPEGEALLKAVGSVSIPVVAIFSPGENAHSPLVLRDLVTRNQVAEALKAAATRK